MSNRKEKFTDPRGGHSRLYWEVQDSPAFRALTACDQRAYWAILRQLNSFNNGDLSLPFSYASHHGITNETSLAKHLRALAAVGLIAVTRRTAHRRNGSRLPNLYRLTDFPVFAVPAKHIEASPATNEWKQVKSIAAGQALIRKAEEDNAAAWKQKLIERAARKAAKEGTQK